MRSKLLRVPRLVAYARNFNAFAQNAKSYSTKGPTANSTEVIVDDLKEAPIKKETEREILLLGPKDFRAPLPGNVGLAESYAYPAMHIASASNQIKKVQSDLFESDLPPDRHRNVLNFTVLLNQVENSRNGCLTSSLNELLECIAQDCPMLVKKDLQDLFPNRDLSMETLTVITLCQRTINDMSSWSHETDLEREELMACFVTAAQEICDGLKEEGYWADFIDPSSGRPFLGEYTNATMFETDERYRHFGLDIEDLGCCKVISHHLWGTHAFLGSIFTNASLESPHIQGMLERNRNANK